MVRLPVVYLYPFMIIQMMMGEPNRAVMELMGRMPCVAATCEMMSQASMMVVPHKMAAGMMVRWSDVRKIPRAIWGTVIPMKAIGPVNAVEVPARSAVDRGKSCSQASEDEGSHELKVLPIHGRKASECPSDKELQRVRIAAVLQDADDGSCEVAEHHADDEQGYCLRYLDGGKDDERQYD